MKLSVGRLRRLVLLKPQYTYILDEIRKPEWEAIEGHMMREWTRQFLQNWRGYEILYYDDSTIASISGSKDGGAEDEKIWQSLFVWTDASSIDDIPPENLTKLIKDIGEHLAVDGVLVIQGYQEVQKNSSGKGKAYIKADILESTTGRLVWKCRLTRSSPKTTLGQQVVKALFAPIEFAVPKVLIE